MSSPSTKPARGMRDFLPADVRRRAHVIGVVTDVYERYGFEPLETPAVENLETLMGKYGEEGNQLIFKVLKRGDDFQAAMSERVRAAAAGLPAEQAKRVEALQWAILNMDAPSFSDLALRYDLTVPLARVVAEYRAQLPKFFKRYQIQPVWRADRPARGRFREFYQCDVDVLGSRSMVVEAELCAAVSDVLERLGFASFVIRVNHRQVLDGILAAAGVPTDRAGEALVAVDKLDKIGREGVDAELQQRGISAVSADKLLGLFERVGGRLGSPGADSVGAGAGSALVGADSGSATEAAVARAAATAARASANADLLQQLAAFVGDHAAGQRGLAELREALTFASPTSAGRHIAIDPSLARGLSYYTGAIMEIAVPDLAGSLGGGGRYDNLVGMFLGQDVPACGFSLGLERLIVVMTERGMFPPGLEGAPADVMVTLWNADAVAPALALARELRAAGLRVDVYAEPDKIGKQLKYASSRGIPKVAVLGEDEIAQGVVAIKDMQTGAQQTVPRHEAANAVRGRFVSSSSEQSTVRPEA